MVGARIWTRFNQLLNSVLTLSDVGHRLDSLATGWSDLTNADIAFVSVVQPDRAMVVGSLVQGDRSVESVEFDCSDTQQWIGQDVLQSLLSTSKLDASAYDSQTVIPFLFAKQSSAGVILFSKPGSSLDLEIVEELSDLSARLIGEQGHCQSSLAECDCENQNGLQAAKLESLAEFAAGAGHEINNPLATITGRVQLLLKGETDPERRRALMTIGGQAYRVRDMIGDTMLFGRPPKPDLAQQNLSEIVKSVLLKFEDQAKTRNCTMDLHSELDVPIWADPTQIALVTSSLIQNSLDASCKGGTISIKSESVSQTEQEYALLSVSDNGPGLSEEEREHLFDPFYSGRQAGRGLGFGLSKSWRIIENHGGWMEVDSKSDKPIQFRVYCPARPDQV